VNAFVYPLCAGELQHLHRRIEACHFGVESHGQRFGESPGSTTEVEYLRDRSIRELNGDRVHPEVEHLGTMVARAIVGGGDVRPVVVGHSILRTRRETTI